MTEPWWKNACVYQIWPASYKDSNGDGIGDIKGIISTLDYLKDLGVDIIWLSPMYKSPQHDMGYDISDYHGVHEAYGTMEDMDALIEGCHSRGMKLCLDLVVNHTSNEHKWFLESRTSRDNPKRNWYIWKPPKYDSDGKRQPPNNWRGIFGGSAWEWDEKTQEYYLHLFVVEQPDLNWENPETRKAIYEEAANFWLKKGVDGFRIDTVNLYSKVQSYPDAPVVDKSCPWQSARQFYVDGPRIHEFLRELNENTFSKFDCMTVGECPGVNDPAEVNKYVGAARKELDMIFQFDLVEMGQGTPWRFDPAPYSLRDVKKTCEWMQKTFEGTDGWSTSFLENHDQGRAVSRFLTDDPAHRAQSSKLAATWTATMSGTLFVYQGQEIGMINIPASWGPEEYKDVESKNYWQHIINTPGADKEFAMKRLRVEARDNGRTPVQWENSKHGGFTTGTPWMRVNESYSSGVNVKSQLEDSDSPLKYWQKMIALRKKYKDLFVFGTFSVYDRDNENVFSYVKTDEKGNKAVVVLNFSASKQSLILPTDLSSKHELISHSLPDGKLAEDTLAPYESRVYFVPA